MFWSTIILFVIFLLILVPSIFKLYRKGESQGAKTITNICVFYSILFLFIKLLRVSVPNWTILLTMTAAFISGFFGQYLRMYYKSLVFDRYLHAYGSFGFALLSFHLLNHFLTVGGSPLFLALFVFLLGNTLGVIFELLEFSYDLKPTNFTKSQHGLKDTDMDMLFNLFGSIGAAIFIFLRFS